MKDIKIEIDPRFIVDTDCEYWRGIDFCSECDWHSTIFPGQRQLKFPIIARKENLPVLRSL